MAVTLTEHRTVWNGASGEADAATNWTGTTTVFTADPAPVEATGCLGFAINAVTAETYNTAGVSVNMTNKLVWVWVYPRHANDTTAAGGLQMLFGDATPDRVGYHVAGVDLAAFRHDTGPVGWQCMLVDTSNLPATTTVMVGTLGGLDFTAITALGAVFKNLAMAPGGISNYFIDIMRYMDPTANDGCALSIVGGTSGDPGIFSEIAALDRSTGNLQGYGCLRELGSGLFGLQAPLRFGNATGTASSWFEDKNASVAFESRGLLTTRYKIFITDNGTGTTTFRLGTKVGTGVTATGAEGCIILAPPGVGWEFDAATDPDVTDVFIYGSTFKGASGGISFRAGHEFIGGLIDTSGQVVANGATMVNTNVFASTVVADASALLWNVATNPDGFLDGMAFSKGTTAHHAIEFGTTAPTTITLNNITFTGFNGANGNNDSTLNFTDGTGKNYTVNIIGGTSPSYKVAGTSTVTIVANPVTTLINIKDPEGNNEAGVRVYLEAANGTGDLPYQQAINSITRSGTTATVTFATDHGLATDEYLKVEGITDKEEDLSGAHQVTVTSATVLTYQTTNSGSTNYTGTIVGTGVTIYGTTDASGNISSSRTYSVNQPLTGYARKSDDGTTYFKSIDLVDTVISSTGLTINRRLVGDGLV